MKKLNVAFAKAGKSVLFDKKKWDMYGGAHETTQLISTFAQMNPNINIVLLGKNDWRSLDQKIKDKINVNNNIIDVWADWDPKKGISLQDWPLHFCQTNKIDVDFALIVVGPTGQCSTRGKIYKMKSTEYAIPMAMMERYMGPLTVFLNETKIPYIEWTEDPRYLTIQSRDLVNRSRNILAAREIEEGISIRTVKGMHSESSEFLIQNIPVTNGNTSRMFLMAEPNRKLNSPGLRKNLISVYSNGMTGTGGMQKFPYIRDYVLDNFPTSTIYGMWTEEMGEIGPYQHRIHPTPMTALLDQMYDTKYAFMIPIKKGGWTSAKFFKHLLMGIIPFFHEYSYTEYYGNIPEYLCLKSPADFKEKIEFLEANPDEYLKLWNQCQAMLEDSFFTGEYYNNIILGEIIKVFPAYNNELRENIKPKEYNMSCLFADENGEPEVNTEIKIKNIKPTIKLF